MQSQTNRAQQIQDTLNSLLALGLSPLPVAPKQDPVKFSKKSKSGEIELTAEGTPKPRFNGKNPSFLDRTGHPQLINHTKYQTRQPSRIELDLWFSNPDTGIGCLGSENFIWIDLDSKQFSNQEACDTAYKELLESNPVLNQTWLEKTQSNGYRIGVRVLEKPNFTNFSLSPGGSHVGEALGFGRFTVLAPTLGLSGNAYVNLNLPEKITEIKNLEEIGIYPVSHNKSKSWASSPIQRSYTTIASDSALDTTVEALKVATTTAATTTAITTAAIVPSIGSRHTIEDYKMEKLAKGATGIFLIETITPKNREILHGVTNEKDKSKAFTTALNDLFGYSNWLQSNNVEFYGDPHELALIAGLRLGLDSDKINRIVQSLSIENLQPAAKYRGGDEACWKRVKALDKNAYSQAFGIETVNLNSEDVDPNFVDTTVENTILGAMFEHGNGKYKVLNSAYHEYQPERGFWKSLDDNTIEKRLTDKLPELYTYKKVGEDTYKKQFKFATQNNKINSFKYCRSAISLDGEIYNDHLLNFNNCTVDLRTGKQQPHSRENFLTTIISADYIENAECPEVFRKFISDAYGDDMLPIIRAITSMLLDPTAPYGYFPWLLGASGSGKGTLSRLWTSMFGIENVKTINDFSDLSNTDKRHQVLTGSKIINFADMSGFQSKGVNDFYELVDNGQMSGRALFSSSTYDKKWNLRFIISSVNLLNIENSGAGWDRRVIPLHTKGKPLVADKSLETQLGNCKAEIISWALSMPREERDNWLINHASLSKTIGDRKKEQSLYSDPVKSFIDQCLWSSESEFATIQNHQLYDYYSSFCKVNGYGVLASAKFLAHIKLIIPNNRIERKSIRQNGIHKKIPAHFSYITVVPNIFSEVDSSFGSGTIVNCNKKHCQDGGLSNIEEFWKTHDQNLHEQSEPHQPLDGRQLNLQLNQKPEVEPKIEPNVEPLDPEPTVELLEPEPIDYENTDELCRTLLNFIAQEEIGLRLGKIWETIQSRSSIQVQKELNEFFSNAGELNPDIRSAHQLYLESK